MKKLLEVLTKLLGEGKSQEQIVAWFADEANTKGIEDIQTADFGQTMAKAFEAHSRKQQIEGAFTAQAGSAAKKSADDELDKRIETKALELMAKMPVSNPLSALGAKGFQVVRDDSWKEPMAKMIRLAAAGRDSEAREVESGIKAYNLKQYGIKATVRGDSDSVGGYSVAQDWQNGISMIQTDMFGVIADLNELTISSDTYNAQSINTVTSTWTTNQDTALTETNNTWATSAITLRDLGGFTKIANDIIADTAFNLLDVLGANAAESLGREISKGVLCYDVSTTADPFNGIYFLTSLPERVSASGTLSYTDIISLVGKRTNRSLVGAKFYMNMKTLLEIETMLDNVGRPVVRVDLAGGINRMILGFPVVVTEDLPNTFNSALTQRTGGTFSTIIFGNLTKDLTYVTKAGSLEIDFDRSQFFTSRMTVMRFCKRMGWGVPADIIPTFARLSSFTLTI